MVPVLGFLRHSRHPGSPITFSIRAHHGNRNFHKRTYRRSASSHLLMFEQNQRKVYREVLIAADTSSEDENRAVALSPDWSAFPDGRGASDTVEFAYDNDTVYFAQPNLSQFLPGGYGLGVFNQSASIDQKDTLNNPLLLTGRNAPKNNAGMILRYAPLIHLLARDVAVRSDVCSLLDTLSGGLGFAVRSYPTLK